MGIDSLNSTLVPIGCCTSYRALIELCPLIMHTERWTEKNMPQSDQEGGNTGVGIWVLERWPHRYRHIGPADESR